MFVPTMSLRSHNFKKNSHNLLTQKLWSTIPTQNSIHISQTVNRYLQTVQCKLRNVPTIKLNETERVMYNEEPRNGPGDTAVGQHNTHSPHTVVCNISCKCSFILCTQNAMAHVAKLARHATTADVSQKRSHGGMCPPKPQSARVMGIAEIR